MRRTSAYRAEPGSIAAAAVAIRVGTLAWVAAALIGTPVAIATDGNARWWVLMCAVGVISGLGGMAFLGRKVQGT